MKTTCLFPTIFALSIASLVATAAEEPKTSGEAKMSANDPTTAPSLRKPGFVFMELATPRVEEYVAYFESVAEFKVTRRLPDYVDTRSDHAELTFLGPKIWGGGHRETAMGLTDFRVLAPEGYYFRFTEGR